MIVSLEDAKAHLRYDGSENDSYLNGLIESAEAVIRRHVDAGKYDPANAAMRHAALLLIGYWDENRNTETGNGWYLPPPVLALLTPYRTPTAV